MDNISQAIVSLEVHFADKSERLRNAWAVVHAELAEGQKPSHNKPITPVCDWCGKSGHLITKHYHRACHEAVLNGEGII